MRTLPADYERFRVGRIDVAARGELVPLAHDVLRGGTLYDFAKSHPEARAFGGRQPAYAFPLPRREGWIVVRHNRHGGLLAGLTGDRFLRPTRALRELVVAHALAVQHVPTPHPLGCVIYPAGPGFARSDVITRLVTPSRDLAAVLAEGDGAARAQALEFTARLVGVLSRAGAHHADLNSKNVLIATEALVLDVDRVQFGWSPRDALAANLRRLDRSLRKRREQFNEIISDAEIAELARLAARPQEP